MQFKNQDGRPKLSSRYLQYSFAKQCVRGESPREILPLGEAERATNERHEPKNSKVETSQTIRSRYGNGSGSHIAKAVLTPGRIEKRQNGRRFKEDGDPSFTLNCQDIHGVSDGVKIRRLTPLECERLQGFEDGWTEGISDTQRYKVCGNAVTVKVVEEVLKSIFN